MTTEPAYTISSPEANGFSSIELKIIHAAKLNFTSLKMDSLDFSRYQDIKISYIFHFSHYRWSYIP